MLFETHNGTGTGEIDLLIKTQDKIPVGKNTYVQPMVGPKDYMVTWNYTAKPDPNCDPTKGPCEQWLPGNYTVSVGMYSIARSITTFCFIRMSLHVYKELFLELASGHVVMW